MKPSRHPAAARPAPELLAPAGGPEAGYAALQYGADAVYLGLPAFSARAEAENFTPDQLAVMANYAHSLTPRRRVYVTVNTVVQQRELDALVETLCAVAEAGADAVIVQDLGAWRLVRSRFPRLRLHASTQMAVHNREGAEALQRLGAARVTLARELTLGEIGDIARSVPIEVETFVHGALCYCYSGLCLFSSHTTGRSANRGRCAYMCRDLFRLDLPGAGERSGHAFSMKDLALGDSLDALRRAGVASLKIEGRKKSALYVACVTDYYRRLLDGGLSEAERREREERIRTVFSRPWTRLFVTRPHAQDVIDPEIVGHRGTRIGHVERVIGAAGQGRLRLTVSRAVAEHDGLQIDVPGLPRPFGFAVQNLRVRRGAGFVRTFEAPAASELEVDLPGGYPRLPADAPVYLASSQAVKSAYPVTRPKHADFRLQFPVRVALRVDPGRLAAAVSLAEPPGGGTPCAAEACAASGELAGPFEGAKDPAAVEHAARQAFEKTGDTPFRLAAFEWLNPAARFVPVSRLNALRRELLGDLAARLEDARRRAADALRAAVRAEAEPPGAGEAAAGAGAEAALAWSIKVNDLDCLAELPEADWAAVEEVVLDLDALDEPALPGRLDAWRARPDRPPLRLALPVILRAWDRERLLPRIAALRRQGWTRWETSNLWGWSVLRAGDEAAPAAPALDIAAGWPLYCLNSLAIRTLLELGATRVTLSPEDDAGNLRSLLQLHGPRAVLIAYQDTPLFIAEGCPRAALTRPCNAPEPCGGWTARAASGHGQRFLVQNRHGRTVVINAVPFCAADRLEEFKRSGLRRARVDLAGRPYAAAEAARVWREVRAGRAPAPSHAGNLARGMA